MAEIYPSIGDEEGNAILTGFQIESISPNHKADLICAPIEIGEKKFDNKVLQPITIEVSGHIQAEDYSTTLPEMLEMWTNREYKFYKVLTRNGMIYSNLCLQNVPMKETPEKFDLVYCTLSFQEMIITKKMERVAAKVADSKTKNGGTKGARG